MSRSAEKGVLRLGTEKARESESHFLDMSRALGH